MPSFTVTIAGPERHNGEKPYTYVVDATNALMAKAIVRTVFENEQETDDELLLEVLEGVPDPDCGFHWNDLRKPATYKLDFDEQDMAEIGALTRGVIALRDSMSRRVWSLIGHAALGKIQRIRCGDYLPLEVEDEYEEWIKCLQHIADTIFAKFKPGDGQP